MNFGPIVDYCNECLKVNGDVLSYLERRHISLQSVDKFKIGYFPPNSDILNRYDTEELREYKVVSESGYSFFSDRLIFPIFDTYGQIVALSGRTLVDEKKRKETRIRKYFNTKYDKHKYLFGLNFAIDETREKDWIVLTEGQIDVISAHQRGLTNVVASCGTGLDIVQIALLARYASLVYLLYDADKAGDKAGQRALQFYQKPGVQFKKIVLSKGEDLDSFLQSHSVDDLLGVLSYKEVKRDELSILKERLLNVLM